MDQTSLPPHLKSQLDAALDAVMTAALEKGLDVLLAFELWDVRERVEEAQRAADPDLATAVIDGHHGLLERIERLPSRHANDLRMNRGSLLLSGY